MARPMANDPPFATLNHFEGDSRTGESDFLRIGINGHRSAWSFMSTRPSENGPGDVKSPRVIVTPPSSRFCLWSARRIQRAIDRKEVERAPRRFQNRSAGASTKREGSGA